jgi:dethiobiotin synthetase
MSRQDTEPSSLFITGTDTGVGKTVVTALLALRLRSCGIHAGVMKPFASGCRRENGRLVSDDAEWLQAVTGVDDDLSLINPVRFEEPLAPLVAARRAGVSGEDDIMKCRLAYEELQRRHDCVLVEGVGGLMVPLQEVLEDGAGAKRLFTCADFADLLGLPVVVAARRTLGTINHSVLTCRASLHAPAHFAGLVFCDAEPVANDDVAAQSSPAIVAEMTGLPIWGQVPYLEDLSVARLRAVAERHLAAAFVKQTHDRHDARQPLS